MTNGVENPVEKANQHWTAPVIAPSTATEAQLLREIEKLRASFATVAKDTVELRAASNGANVSFNTDVTAPTAVGSLRYVEPSTVVFS